MLAHQNDLDLVFVRCVQSYVWDGWHTRKSHIVAQMLFIFKVANHDAD